jgi:predicted protein tyrosine phosphatase
MSQAPDASDWVVALFVLALFAGPLVNVWLTGRQAKTAQEADWERQDKVAARLLKAQAATAKTSAEAATATSEKLEVIHALVNSDKTALLENELVAYQTTLVLLEAEHKREPTNKTATAVTLMTNKITELEAQLADRRRANGGPK